MPFTPEQLEDAWQLARRERAEQGLPETVEDETVRRRLARKLYSAVTEIAVGPGCDPDRAA